MVRMIAAVADGFVIGKDGGIPWDLPEDRRVFKELTMGNALIMGRKTFESIGRPLPGRDTIVVTSHAIDCPSCAGGTILVAESLKQAIRMAGEKDAFLCGGERIYAEGLACAEVLYLTKVELTVSGDAFFPKDYERFFKPVRRERLSAVATLFTYVKE